MAHSYPIGSPAFIPERRDQFARLVREAVAVVLGGVVGILEELVAEPAPETFLAAEEEILPELEPEYSAAFAADTPPEEIREQDLPEDTR